MLVVAEKANENLWKIISFLRDRFRIPLGFVKFETYRLKAANSDELVIHFDTSDADMLLNQITGEDETLLGEIYEQSKDRYFWYNTDKDHLDPSDIHDKVFKLEVAATYGPAKYGEKLASAHKGDYIFAYANGEGIRAFGRATGEWNGKSASDASKTVTDDPGSEYHLPVNWEMVLTKENAIRPDEIRALGYNNFRGTFRRIYDTEFTKKLRREIDARQ